MARFRASPTQFPPPSLEYDRDNEAQFRSMVDSALQDATANVTSLVDADTLDGHDSSFFRALTNVVFTDYGTLLVDSVEATGTIQAAGNIRTMGAVQSWSDFVFDTLPLVQFGDGAAKFNLGDGSVHDLRVGRTAAGVFSADVGLIRADELGASGQNAAHFHNASNLSTGTVADARLSANVGLLSASNTWALSQIFTAAASFQGPTVPFVVVGTSRVDNLNAEKWDSLGRGTSGQVVLAVSAGASVWGQIDNSHVLGAAAIAWSKISKTGSTLADIDTRSAGDLSSGTLLDARLSSNVALLNGSTAFSTTQTAPNFILNAAAGTNRDIQWKSGGSLRWVLRVNSSAESGSNAGSNVDLLARDDTGAALFSVLSITRANGAVTYNQDMAVNGAFTANGSFKHVGSTLAFYNHALVARSAAYTQTYATADRTHAARTAAVLTDSVGGTVGTTLVAIPDPADSPLTADALRDDLVTNVLPKLRNAISSLLDQHNKLNADHLDTAQFANVIVDDMRANGMFQ